MRSFLFSILFFLFMGLQLSEAGVTDPECIQCHASTTIAKTVHENFACVDCHSDIQELPHEETALVECQTCHEEAQEKYGKGRHGVASAKDDFDAPLCSDCHGTHDIRAANDEKSTVYPRNQIETCAVCHADPKVAKRHTFTIKAPVEAYKNSVHFKALTEGGKKAPSCASCHGTHEVRRAGDPASSINWENVSGTCGKCHVEIMKVYQESIHGKAVAAGSRHAPICTDCHGEHEIRAPGDPKSSVYPARIVKTTCVWCHESLRVTQKFGLPGERLSTYLSSYHGLANQAGSEVVANCASCHGIHNIRPSSDPESTIHPSNLPRTCGKCHPGVGQNVALGAIHIDSSRKEGNKVVYYVRLFYLFLIFFVVALMLLHNGLDLARKFRSERLPDGKDYLRLTLPERLQHAALVLSFMVLAYSGFALAFPQTWWPAAFSFSGGTEEERRLVHRIAALAMLVVCMYHLAYLLLATRGRAQLRAILPRWKDIKDFVRMWGYYLGKQTKPPAFARFSYMEKTEYWSLVWGSVVMVVTGFALWFSDVTLRYAPKWMIDVATTIHYYEACLAVLAIFVWHFYWVIFNPKSYPMSLVWLTGRMSEQAMREEHPLELEEIKGEQAEDGQKGGAVVRGHGAGEDRNAA